jgi:uncharacterized protein (DUF1697 family)
MARTKAVVRYLAFLRGINVGGHRVNMERLRELFAALDFANVSTFIASGNVIFDAPGADTSALEHRIEAHLEQALGYAVDTFLRTPTELAAIVGFQPFAADDLSAPNHTVHVGFYRNRLSDDDANRMLTFRTPMDDFRIEGRELYWLCRGKTTDSLVSWPVVAKAVKTRSTMRNLKTVRQLAAKYPPD